MTAPATVTPDTRHTTDYVTAWRSPSRRHAHVAYLVTFDRLYNEWHCQCPSWGYRGRCAHVDAAIAALVAAWRTPRRAEEVA
jgi:hypothetical protein